jgi:hypothetical protein
MGRIKKVFWILLLLCVSPVMAQQLSCPAIVETALQAVDTLCRDTGRNQACYGNVSLEAIARANVDDFNFDSVGDIADVNDLQSLKLDPMNDDPNDPRWGVAMMRLQANLPDTLPGQNVTFLLFGDVEITQANTFINPEEEYAEIPAPMSAFYLRTGIGDAPCAEVPESGLLVQTPEGIGTISFNVNGVDVSLGSTVFFQTDAEGEMNVTTVEGSASLTIEGESYPVLAGTQRRVLLNTDYQAQGEPESAQPYIPNQVAPLPVQSLERPIEIAPPMPEERIQEVETMIANGQPPCGQPDLPNCEHLPEELGGSPCALPGTPEADAPDTTLCIVPAEAENSGTDTDSGDNTSTTTGNVAPEGTDAVGVPTPEGSGSSESTPDAVNPTDPATENNSVDGVTPTNQPLPAPTDQLIPTQPPPDPTEETALPPGSSEETPTPEETPP